jgi:transposase
MTKRNSTPPEAALVAIDVAKYRNEVLIEPVRGGHRRRITVLNSRGDHDRFIALLQALKKPISVGIEPTGDYYRVLAHRLTAAGFGVRLISSVALARTREALHNGWDKMTRKMRR